MIALHNAHKSAFQKVANLQKDIEIIPLLLK